MSELPSIPEFAVVGHPNEGKSSVVATLAEDDRVGISAMPGETQRCQSYPVKIDEVVVLRFIDTPGFQHPQKMRAWLSAQVDTGIHLAAAFRQAHAGQPELAHDLELLRPLAHGCGVIYVVDGSRPVRQHDLAEMEILRLLGNPRMAVINPKQDAAAYLREWKAACGRAFNATRVFDAVRATYAERIALLQSLRSMHQDWEPALNRTIRAFEAEWAQRSRRVAFLLVDLIKHALRHQESQTLRPPQDESAVRAQLIHSYQENIAHMEQRAHREIRRLYKHNIFRPSLESHPILSDDLFTEKTWRILGLNRRQVATAAALVGAAAGVKLDLVLPHLTFGVGTLSGAALAGAAAWFRGERIARARVKRIPLGGIEVVVGPNRSAQFPFILLDRGLLYYRSVIHWAHARPSSLEPKAGERGLSKQGFTARWPLERTRSCFDCFRRLVDPNPDQQELGERALRDLLLDVLNEVAHADDVTPGGTATREPPAVA